jgi:hypothetical protein
MIQILLKHLIIWYHLHHKIKKTLFQNPNHLDRNNICLYIDILIKMEIHNIVKIDMELHAMLTQLLIKIHKHALSFLNPLIQLKEKMYIQVIEIFRKLKWGILFNQKNKICLNIILYPTVMNHIVHKNIPLNQKKEIIQSNFNNNEFFMEYINLIFIYYISIKI